MAWIWVVVIAPNCVVDSVLICAALSEAICAVDMAATSAVSKALSCELPIAASCPVVKDFTWLELMAWTLAVDKPETVLTLSEAMSAVWMADKLAESMPLSCAADN